MPTGPIFVAGTMRSGSTLFRLILDAHPRIAVSEETGFVGGLVAAKNIPNWIHGRGWYERLGFSEKEFDARLRDFYSGMFERYAAAQGKQRWGEKTPFHSRHIPEMAAVFPDSVFVGIVRHPGAVVHSLVEKFHYVPTKTFPYILYSSYAEFLETNVFAVSEGTLGITSTEGDLKLSLPYLGDHKLFEEVSTHELAHQFTIQKVRTLAGDRMFGDPLQAMPLWFIEGLAEFYAQRGLDAETEMLARDLLVNPDLMRGYAFLDFFSQGPYGFLWIYKVGQMRVAFLEEEYGAGFAQKVLDASPRLVGGAPGSSSIPFEELLKQLTGDEPKKISTRFEAWMKRRAFKTYLSSQQSAPVLDMLEERAGIITAFTSGGKDGRLIAYRTIVPETGESRLYLADSRAPGKAVKVVGDGKPGYESLHPIAGRNFAIAQDKLAFIAESNARDVVYVQGYTHQSQQRSADVLVRPTELTVASRNETAFDVDLDLGERRAFPMAQHKLLAIYSPAFSPDGKQLAFIGISDVGVRDVYMMNVEASPDTAPTRLTDDIYSERQLTWGPTGIIFTSDATSHRHYNLFRVRPEAPGQVQRLTTQETDEADPLHLPDGRIFFVAYTHTGSDLHELMADGRIVRRTDLVTGVFEPGPGPEGSLWMSFHHAGERRPATLRPEKMLSLNVESLPPADPPVAMAQRALTDATPYRPFAWENLELGPVMGFAGAGGGFFVGQVFAAASDRLRDHAMLLNLAVYGSFDLTDGYLLYLNQEKRTTWGFGLFQSLRFRVDETFGGNAPFLFSSGERFYGALGSLRYPLNTFFFLQGDLSIGGTSYFLDDFTEFVLYTDENRDFYSPWREANRGSRFQSEASVQLGYNTLRYHYLTGPLTGSSAMLETTVAVQPFHDEVFGNVRLDAEHYFPIIGRTNLGLRAAAGTTFGGRFARSYFLYTFDTLRGVNFGDVNWLLGRNFFFSTAELQIPFNDIIRVAFLSDVEGIIGLDFGGVGNTARGMWDKRVLDFALGVNVMLGPMMLRLHFARPLGVGSPFGKPDPDWVTNFSLGFAGMPGFFDTKGETQPRRVTAPAGFGAYTSPRGGGY